MIKRTIEISNRAAHLKVRNEQLVLETRERGDETSKARSIPCEDVGMLLVDHRGCTYTHAALATLMEHGAAVVLCGSNHLPAGMLVPLGDHSEVAPRMRAQLDAAKPVRKRLWQQVVQAKVAAQAANLAEDSPARRRLAKMKREVRSGDATNVEAQAAKLYWRHWLGPDAAFRRDADACDLLNSMLNYGYAVLRAGVARALVGAGLLPLLGLHHHNRQNAFALADDLMEPLRPLVDARVREVASAVPDEADLSQAVKAPLLEVQTRTVTTDDRKGPLMVALHGYANSYVDVLQGHRETLAIPTWDDA